MNAPTPALVILNPRARHGKAPGLWKRIEPVLAERFCLTVAPIEWIESAVAAAYRDGTRCFIAAGGDGTVHALANALVAGRGRFQDCILGAVGLGSSNDFHKPAGRRLVGIAVRVETGAAAPRDVGIATFEGQDGRSRRRAFLVSGSLGACAQANRLFGTPDRLQHLAKRAWTGAAILLAAVRAILAHAPIPAELRLGGASQSVRLSSLSVMKTPYLAGALRYDAAIAPDDGRFAVHLCEGMSRSELAVTLAALAFGRFSGRPKTRSVHARQLSLACSGTTDLELDGELYAARKVRFELLAGALRVCA